MGCWLRFLIGGSINTVFTYFIYLALNLLMPYQAAYLIAYAAGIIFSYWFNARIVFKTLLSWQALAAYPMVYVVQYIASALLLENMIGYFAINESIAPLAVTAAMVPLTYGMSQFILNALGRRKK